LNFGNNIFLDNDTRAQDRDIRFGSAVETQWVNANLWVAYEWKENFFIETNIYLRQTNNVPLNFIGSIGIRWNMHRREYDF
jgi:hypothetical protein